MVNLPPCTTNRSLVSVDLVVFTAKCGYSEIAKNVFGTCFQSCYTIINTFKIERRMINL